MTTTTQRLRRTARLALAVAVCAALGAGCGEVRDGSSGDGRSTVTIQETQTLVAIGSGATVGEGLGRKLRDPWPRLFHREAFPRSTVLVNAAVANSSTEDALVDQVPLAEELSPSVVAIWLGTIEAFNEYPLENFEENLRQIVRRVRAGGARVLLADLPTVTTVDVDGFNRVIARVAADEGATLVPLHGRTVRALAGEDWAFLPDRAGHRAIADAFIDAYAALRR
jgi:lysophospholipase L1-like esterase